MIMLTVASGRHLLSIRKGNYLHSARNRMFNRVIPLGHQMGTMQVDKYAFDTVDRLRNVSRTDDVVAELTDVMLNFGFNTYVVTGLPRPDQRIDAYVLASRWPQGWIERYFEGRYHGFDPTVRRVRQTLNPFRWSVVRNESLTREEVRVMDEAREFGLADGFAVPIHDLNGLEAVISFGTDIFDLDTRQQAAIHLISLYAYECLRRARRSDYPGGSGVRLGPRERECVQWTAAGKSAWEIGQILGLSEATVKEYLRSAARKMDVRTKPQLVARCLKSNLIS